MIISNQTPCFGPGRCEYRTLSSGDAEIIARNEETWYLLRTLPFSGLVTIYRQREGL